MSEQLPLFPRELLTHEQVGTDAFVLGFKRNFNFKAGQVIHLTVNDSIPPRIYSICSGEKENECRILYKYVSTGTLTPLLKNLKPGATLMTSTPVGSFTFTNEPGVCIGTGTGIAPFISMVRSGVKNKTIIQGARYCSELYFQSELALLNTEHYKACITGENKEGCYHGRVTAYIKENFPGTHCHYYLCGSAEMVVDVRDLLIESGVPFNNIHAEIYF